MNPCYSSLQTEAIPILPVTAERLQTWLTQQSGARQAWIETCKFVAKPGSYCLVANEMGALERVLFGVTSNEDFLIYGSLPNVLPKGLYYIDNSDNFLTAEQHFHAELAWGLGSYQFTAYRKPEVTPSVLAIHLEHEEKLNAFIDSIYLVRDLVNTPADDMGPAELTEAAKAVAAEFDAKVNVVIGDDLLEKNFPTIHAVGRGAAKPPRFIDLTWGNADAPKITLVGKGICFDSGGLDIKPAAGMRQMKKDMAGAAHALALARLIMWAGLPVRLRVLIAAAENAVDGASYHPGDVITTRAGITVEIDNTDAEGRLVMCDAISEAMSDQLDYLFDFATLTGAARVALGPDLVAMFCNNDEFANNLLTLSQSLKDPMWRMPLYQPYFDLLQSDIADMANSAQAPYGGAITAALFLQRFVSGETAWVHFDMLAANLDNKPGRPRGGEACVIRTCFEFLRQKYV